MEPCERCGEMHGIRFVCLGQHLCFACANAVVRLTSRYPALHEIASSELAETVSDHSGPATAARCPRCGADAAPLRLAGQPLCDACARELTHAV